MPPAAGPRSQRGGHRAGVGLAQGLELVYCGGVLKRDSDVVEAMQEAVLYLLVDLELDHSTGE